MINERNMMHGLDYLGEDVSGWLMSEKLDGCRAFWDGSQMWTRGGNVVALPDVMVAALPVGVAMDGELFAGRDGFEVARQFVQYGRWDDRVEFRVFDAPDCPGCFGVRYSWLENNRPFEGIVSYIHHDECDGADDAFEFLEAVQECYGGEGVMLRDPANLYRPGRSEQILKLLKGRV